MTSLIKALDDYVHSKGLKLGIYSSAGCSEAALIEVSWNTLTSYHPMKGNLPPRLFPRINDLVQKLKESGKTAYLDLWMVSSNDQQFTSEYGIPKSLHPKLPGPEEPIVEFSEGKVGVYTKFFEFANYRIPISQFLFDILGYYQIHLSQLSVIGAAKVDERIFPTVVEWRTSAPKDKMPSADSYSAADVTILDTHRTPIQKQLELLLCLVGLSQSYFLGDDVYPIFLYDDDWDMDLFNLISAPNAAKVKTGTRPHAAHEVPLLTVTDGLSHEILPVETATTTEVVQELWLEKEVAAMGPPVNKRRLKRGNDEAEANAPPKVLRKDHAAFRPAQSTLGGRSLASMELEAGSTFVTPATQKTLADTKSVSDPKPLSYAKPQPHLEQHVAQSSRKTAPEIPTKNVATWGVQDLLSTESPGSGKSTSVPSVDGSPGSIYHPGWGVTNNCRMDTPDACQDMYNINLARKVAMRSQLRLRFEQEVRLLKKTTAKIARRDHRIQAREGEIKRLDQEIKSLRTVETEVQDLCNQTKNLETLLEAEVDMKKAAKAKNAGQAKELESLRV
ncbi:gypsy type transposase [Tanacetum coccineum]